MLTGWMRLRYPHVVAGGIAASAPLLMYPADNNSTTYSNIATRTFTTANPACSAGIAQSWSIMTEMGSTAQGLQELSQAFQLCTPLTQASDVENILFPWLANSYSTLPMGDYPYPSGTHTGNTSHGFITRLASRGADTCVSVLTTLTEPPSSVHCLEILSTSRASHSRRE
jgi:hypothetical protein